jgi:hypothetical protein
MQQMAGRPKLNAEEFSVYNRDTGEIPALFLLGFLPWKVWIRFLEHGKSPGLTNCRLKIMIEIVTSDSYSTQENLCAARMDMR